MEAEPNLVFYLIILLILLFVTIFALFVYSGLFAPIEISAKRPPFGNLKVAYKFSRGPYKNAGQLFTEAHSIAPNFQSIGIYYDDPQQVDPADLRYCVGIILPEDGESSETANQLYGNGFKPVEFPGVDHAVLTTFPFNNTLSIFIGIARVYPKLAEYIQGKKLCAHPMIEIYDREKILFMAPLSRQDEFYVEETKEPESPLEEPESQGSDQDSIADHGTASDQEQDQLIQPLVNGPIEDNEDSSGSSFEELHH